MDVLIRLDREEPPAGTVVQLPEVDGATGAYPFVGWLGLLRVLAEIVGKRGEREDG